MKKVGYLAPFMVSLAVAQTVMLQPIDVTDSNQTERKVVQKESYMPSAPSQKQLTVKEALQIAGSNGDPIKALQSFAGVVSTSNDNANEMYIHGSKPRETRYTMNHLPLGYVFHLGGLHSVIAPEATAQIDAYLGGFDTTYDSMGAVVDVMPKYPTGSNKGRIHLGMYDADFAYDMKLGENTNLFIGARRSYFDLIADDIIDELEKDDNDESKRTTFTLFPQFYDAQLMLTHTIENHVLSLEMFHAKDQMKLHTTMNKNLDPVANGKIDSKVSFTSVGTRWHYEGEVFSSMTLLSYFRQKQNLDLFDVNYYVDTSMTRVGVYHETLFHIENHKPLVGFEYYHIKSPVEAHITNPPSSDDFSPLVTDQEVVDLDKSFNATTSVLFMQDIWSITPQNHFRYGVRASKIGFQDFGVEVDPRFAYVHDFTKNTSLSLAIGQYTQFPEYTYVIEGFGNPKIDTSEVSTHYTLNLKTTFEDDSTLEVEPYYKTFKNLAITDDLTKYEAVGEGKAYGLDVTYSKKVENLNLIFAYTYVNAKRQLFSDDTKQYRFEGDIPHTLQLHANYTFTNNWRVSTRLAYSSGSPYTPIVSTEPYVYEGQEYKRPLYGDPYSERMPATYDFDVQIGKTYKYGDGTSMEYSLELMNINALLKKNVDSYKYDDNYERDGEYTQMGFLPAIHVTYRF
jgi:hypothetical protein